MKKIIISFLLLTLTHSYGQELNIPVATQYLADNPFVVSPTFAGIGDNLRIRANGMKQWVGIEDAPQNYSLYADVRIFDQSGVGISMYGDRNGNTSQSGVKLSFAHHIILDYYSKQYLSFGMSFVMNNFNLEASSLIPENYEPLADKSLSNTNFDVGFLYRNRDFFLSLIASNILDKNLDNFSGYKVEPNLLINYQVYSGYVVKLQSWSEIEPSVYYQHFQSDGRSSVDLNLKYRKFNNNNDYYWVGATYRSLLDQSQAFKPLYVGPMAGFKKSGFYFAYSYTVTLNELAQYNSGTHMVTIGFDFLDRISNCPCTQSPVHD